MCGIAGIYSKDKYLDPELIVKMTDIIKYRGPDGYGYLGYNISNKRIKVFDTISELDLDVNYNLYFGHRRLSIIDLSNAGKQPMSFANERYWITYNGEIYNYIEIKEELINKGYKFITHTDTEVVLAAYQEYGTECLQKFNGMWAFAILDKSKNNLFCARDRMGIKPFYYYKDEKYFSFSSEIKQILTLPFIEKKLNDIVFLNFIAFDGYGVDGLNTFFEGINELPAGHYINLDLSKNVIEIEPVKYWDIDLTAPYSLDNFETASDKFYEIFSNAVKLRLRSDVEVGTCLSGGLDSSGIACEIDRQYEENNITSLQKTFTATSEFKEFDETDYAKIVINSTKTNPYFVEPNGENLIKDLNKLIFHQEIPFVSTSIYAAYCIYRLVKENGVTVTLDGQGCDELLGGYTGAFDYYLSYLLKSFQIKEFLQTVNNTSKVRNISKGNLVKKGIKKFAGSHLTGDKRYYKSNSYYKGFLNKDYFKDITKTRKVTEDYLLDKRFMKSKESNYYDKYLYLNLRKDPLPGILKQVDRNSMAFSIEARIPFLDYRLVEYCFTLPSSYKFYRGIMKRIYRNALRNILPTEILNRHSKLGFVTPEPEWLKTHLKDFYIDTFSKAGDSNYLNNKYVLTEFEEFLEGNKPFNPVFWKSLNAKLFLDLNFSRS